MYPKFKALLGSKMRKNSVMQWEVQSKKNFANNLPCILGRNALVTRGFPAARFREVSGRPKADRPPGDQPKILET